MSPTSPSASCGARWRFYQPADPHLFNDVGVGQAIVGTLEQVALGAAMAIPLAFLTAIFLNEVGGWGTRFVRTIVTAMSGVPSVVAGVFIYAIFIEPHILGYSGFAASMALFVLMLPAITRTTEEVLRVVPGRAARGIVSPSARPSGAPCGRSSSRRRGPVLITAVVLGVAIAAGETAPLIFTAFGNNSHEPERVPRSPGRPAARAVREHLPGPGGRRPAGLHRRVRAPRARARSCSSLARLLGRRSTGKRRLRKFVAAPIRWVRSL